MFKMKKLFSLSLFLVINFVIQGCTSNSSKVCDESKLNTNETDKLKLTQEYKGKSFFENGIGVATLSACVDGDTAHFRTANQSISIRFLGIDTPESTINIEPWGRKASSYTCGWLTNAKTIILQADGDKAERDSTATRYLAWVWADYKSEGDFRLINLELMELGLTLNRATKTRYESQFFAANSKLLKSNCRVWGEEDPDFDYTGGHQQVSVGQVYADPNAFHQKNVIISGYVSRKISSNFYLTDNEGSGVYVFAGFTGTTYVKIGMYISVKGQFVVDSTYGPQITDVDHSYLSNYVKTENPAYFDVVPNESYSVSQLNAGEGAYNLVKVSNLTLKTVPANSSISIGEGAFTIYAEDSNNIQFQIRVDKAINSNSLNIRPSDFGNVGDKIDIVGIVSKYYDKYQLMVALKSDIIHK